VAVNARLLKLKKEQTAEKREQELSVNTQERKHRDQKTTIALTKKET
jgi:hypothetical protein